MLAQVAETALFSYQRARSLGYVAENLMLTALSRILPGGQASDGFAQLDPATREALQRDVYALFHQDSRNILDGVYPVSVLRPEAVGAHVLRLPRVLVDGLRVYYRRMKGTTAQFDRASREFLSGLPRYYQRNFHFQTNGYLSNESASLYEHQVELLFGGAADAMRRMILKPLRDALGLGQGEGLRILEIASGTGAGARFASLMYPKAQVVATDLSPVYLAEARRRSQSRPRIDFIQADAEHLPFQSGHFDAVFSIFLFHELPFENRMGVLREMRRVTRASGFAGAVDSMQLGDKPALDSLLLEFPKNFHEPFYRNYAETPLERLFAEAGFADVRKDLGFLSKVCWARN